MIAKMESTTTYESSTGTYYEDEEDCYYYPARLEQRCRIGFIPLNLPDIPGGWFVNDNSGPPINFRCPAEKHRPVPWRINRLIGKREKRIGRKN